MVRELAAAHLLLLWLTLLGLPPALLLQADRRIRVPGALMLAPAFGIALQALVSYPLYRHVGPLQRWGVPVALALTLAAIACLYPLRRRLAVAPGDRADLWTLAIGVATVSAVLSVPFLVGGISRVIFSANPSDTLTYLTLADSVTKVDLATLWAGRAPKATPEAAAVLALSDTALYSARFLALPIRLATMIDLAWFAHLTGIPLERLPLAFATATAMAAAAASLGLLRMFDVDRRLAWLAASLTALGYWAALLRGYDAHSQSQALPVFIALIAARAAAGRFATLRLLCGLLLAGLTCIYTEFAVVLILLVLGETCLFLIRDRRPSMAVAEPMATLASAVVLLLLSGQAPYLWEVVQSQFNFVAAAVRPVGSSPFTRDLASHPFALVTGAAWIANGLLAAHLRPWVVPLEFASLLVVLHLLAAMIHAALRGNRSRALLATPVLSIVPMCLFALLVKPDEYVFFKLFSTVYPALILFLAVSASATTFRHRGVRAFGIACAGLFLVAQSLYVGLWTWREVQGAPIEAPRSRYALDYAMEPMLAKLDDIRPRNLLVYLPPSADWQQAALREFQLKRFRPFPQAGFLIDNRPTRLQHPAMRRAVPVDYALMAEGSDYLQGSPVAAPVFTDDGLTLYRILQDDPMLHEYRG